MLKANIFHPLQVIFIAKEMDNRINSDKQKHFDLKMDLRGVGSCLYLSFRDHISHTKQ